MLTILHWLACLVVLSVALARLEAIKISSSEVGLWLPRALGWGFVGIDAFGGIIAPMFGGRCLADHFGIIGFAVLAISYRWEGATKHIEQGRRASDKLMGHQRATDR